MPDVLHVPNQSLNRLLLYWTFLSASEGQKVALFSNDIEIDADTVYADLEEPAFPGYARQTVTWGTPALAGSRYQVAGVGVTFTQSADDDPVTIYGYFLPWTAGGGNNQMMCVVKFETPIVMENEGDFIDITPKISLGEYVAP